MAVSWAEPDPRRLPRSPLVLVACQLQYEGGTALSDLRRAQTVHLELGGAEGPYPIAELAVNQLLNFEVGPAGAQQTLPQPTLTVRFRSEPGDWTISISPSSVVLETIAYQTWEHFQERLDQLFSVVSEHIRPMREQRLGLRYVNQILDPVVQSPVEWRDYIVPELLGIPLHEQLGPTALFAQQQLLLDLGDGIRCGMRHGFFPKPDQQETSLYLLDFDTFREGSRMLDFADIQQACSTFNKRTAQLFQQSITDRLFDLLRTER